MFGSVGHCSRRICASKINISPPQILFSTSSASWLRRHASDKYATEAREQNLRSRAYFKLKEIQEKYKLIDGNSFVVDLGSAPGGWSLLAAEIIGKKQQQKQEKLIKAAEAKVDKSNESPTQSTQVLTEVEMSSQAEGKKGSELNSVSTQQPSFPTPTPVLPRVCSIDLLHMDPIPGVIFIKGDFTDTRNQQKIINAFGGRKATFIMSDMLHNTTGSKELDHMKSMDICTQALEFCEDNLEPGGAFLCKYLNGKDENELFEYAESMFSTVVRVKPKASRGESSELYLLARQRKRKGK